MKKAFGYTHCLVALVVLLYFCLEAYLIENYNYWEIIAWVMLVTTLLATVFNYANHKKASGENAGLKKFNLFLTLCTLLLVVKQTLAAELDGPLWDFTVLLYVVVGYAVGRRLMRS